MNTSPLKKPLSLADRSVSLTHSFALHLTIVSIKSILASFQFSIIQCTTRNRSSGGLLWTQCTFVVVVEIHCACSAVRLLNVFFKKSSQFNHTRLCVCVCVCFLYVLHENMFYVDNHRSATPSLTGPFVFDGIILPLIALIEPQCGLIASTVWT